MATLGVKGLMADRVISHGVPSIETTISRIYSNGIIPNFQVEYD